MAKQVKSVSGNPDKIQTVAPSATRENLAGTNPSRKRGCTVGVLIFSPRRGLIVVEPSPRWAVLEAQAVAEANAQLTALVETWPELDAMQRVRGRRLALWDLVTITLGDESRGALWTNRLAKRCGLRIAQLRRDVRYRADFARNRGPLCAENYEETIAELCNQILQ